MCCSVDKREREAVFEREMREIEMMNKMRHEMAAQGMLWCFFLVLASVLQKYIFIFMSVKEKMIVAAVQYGIYM